MASFVLKRVDSIIQKLNNDVSSKVHILLSPETSNSTNANGGPESSFLGLRRIGSSVLKLCQFKEVFILITALFISI